MEYREIVAVTGLGGLFQLMATKSDGAIVRNLADKTTKFISARMHNVTPLESIEVYTTNENIRLHNVFQKMKDSEGTIAIIDHKKADNNGIKDYFKSIFPNFDEERVYVSDMKKMLKWYEVLKDNDLLNFENVQPLEMEGAAATPAATEGDKTPDNVKNASEPGKETEATDTEEEKPVKKARAKKAAAATEEADGEAKPAAKKTAARKKKTEE